MLDNIIYCNKECISKIYSNIWYSSFQLVFTLEIRLMALLGPWAWDHKSSKVLWKWWAFASTRTQSVTPDPWVGVFSKCIQQYINKVQTKMSRTPYCGIKCQKCPDPKMRVLACLVLVLYPEKLQLGRFQFFPEPESEPEPQSCFAKRAWTRADSKVESVPAVGLAPMLESVPNIELVPEYETQFLDRQNYPRVRNLLSRSRVLSTASVIFHRPRQVSQNGLDTSFIGYIATTDYYLKT